MAVEEKNLRKFLESDDSAMVQMGLSMAQGRNDESEEILGMILGFYMFHDNKNIRSLAKTSFSKLASSKHNEIVKKYWSAEYRKQPWIWDGWIQKMISELEGINTSYFLIESLSKMRSELRVKIIDMIKVQGEESYMMSKALIQMVSNCTAVYSEKDENVKAIKKVREFSRRSRDNRLVEPLIELLDSDNHSWVKVQVILTLEIFDDIKIVSALIKKLDTTDFEVAKKAANVLGEIGDDMTIEPLLRILDECFLSNESERHWLQKDSSEFATAIGKLGNEECIEPLVKGLVFDLNEDEKTNITNAISLLLKRVEIDEKTRSNLKRFLTAEDSGMRAMGISMLNAINCEDD